MGLHTGLFFVLHRGGYVRRGCPLIIGKVLEGNFVQFSFSEILLHRATDLAAVSKIISYRYMYKSEFSHNTCYL